MAKFASLPVAFGSFTTVTASDTVPTGLKVVRQVVATLAGASASTIAGVTVDVGNQTGAPPAGSFILNGVAAAGTAATVFGKVVNWVAFGD